MPSENTEDETKAEQSWNNKQSSNAKGTNLSRRTALSLLGVGGFGLATSAAAANPGQGNSGGNQPFYNWDEDVDASGNALKALGSLAMAEDSMAIHDFTGENLEINDGVLNAIVPDVQEGYWEDATKDDLLETPDHNGVDVGTVQTEDTSVSRTFEFDGTEFTKTVDIKEVVETGLPDFWHVAANDAELDDVMNDLSDGDRIILGPAEFSEDREFNQSIRILGSFAGINGTDVRADWTFQGYASGIQQIHSGSSFTTITFENTNCFMSNCTALGSQGNIVVNGDNASFSMLRNWDITFEGGTSGGHVGVGTNLTTGGEGEFKQVAYQ